MKKHFVDNSVLIHSSQS